MVCKYVMMRGEAQTQTQGLITNSQKQEQEHLKEKGKQQHMKGLKGGQGKGVYRKQAAKLCSLLLEVVSNCSHNQPS